MKPRRVIVTIECETDAPVKVLRDRKFWTGYTDRWYRQCYDIGAKQVQVNVVRGKGKK